MTALVNRYEIVVLFDVTNGNPNGDPDAGNLPRMDPETSLGLVSDVCLKRKVRNYIEMFHAETPGHRIYVQDGAILNETHREAYFAVRPDDSEKSKKASKLSPNSAAEAVALRGFMCQNFYDVRAFGAVMGTGINCGQVRGPVQFAFARSLEPVVPSEISITRMAATNEAEKKKAETAGDEGDSRTENRTMGRKYILPYGLYRAHIFVSAKLAEKVGFTQEDFDLLIEALTNMFDHDRSAARGEMAIQKLIIFRHDSALGNASAHRLFERVKVQRHVQGQCFPIGAEELAGRPARSFADYHVEIDLNALPEGIEVIEQI